MKKKCILTSLFLFVQIAGFAQTSAIFFKDISESGGMNVSHISSADNRYIVESMSGGAALFDCDADGFLDAATVNGSTVENFKKGGDLFVTLYRQIDGAKNKTPKFENITEAANLTRKGWGMGVTAADFDNDGLTDLFVTGFNGNAVYRGKGGCRYEDATEKSGARGTGFQAGAAWADYDRDGDLDVFVAGYVALDLNNLPVFGSSPTCSFKGIRVQCGPRGLPGERDYFFRNRGDGTFEEVGDRIGVGDKSKHYGLGAIWGDYDNDGWLDLYVANDGKPNYLYKNNRNGTLTEVGLESGTSYSAEGVEQGSMGVAWGDYDNDGKLDLFVSNFDNEYNALYKNLGAKGFLDVALEAKIGAVSKPYVGWGASFEDFDNDGWLDLLAVNGHVYPQIELAKNDSQMGFRQHFLLHRNLGDGTFNESSKEAGLRSLPTFSRRGAAFGDLNNDNLIDVVVANLGAAPTVLLNASENKNQSVALKLIQTKNNRDAIGARVTLKTDKRSMIREVTAGASYLSQNDCRVHFGFGQNERIESIEIRWSDGTAEIVSKIVPDKIHTVTQNRGVTKIDNLQTR